MFDGELEQIVDVHAIEIRARPAQPLPASACDRRPTGVSQLCSSGRVTADDPEEALLQRRGDRPAPAVADRDLVDRSDRRDLDRRAAEERFVGQIEELARQRLLAHLEARGRAPA